MRSTAIAIVAALSLAGASAAYAQSVNGTVNSNVGSSGAHAGVNGTLHSGANATINGTQKSPNGLYNSTTGPKGAHTGTNGKLHSSGNRLINKTK